MGRTRNKLSAIQVRKAAPGLHADGDRLYLQVAASGARSWIFRFKQHGRLRDMGLGPFPEVSLADARQMRDEQAAVLRAGLDPIAARDSRRAEATVAVPTFGEVTELAFEARKASLRGDGTAGRWMSPLEVHVLPVLGKRDITSITQNDIVTVLKPIWRTKTSAAKKALERIGIVLRHAEAAGLDVDARATAKAKALLGDQGHEVQHHPSMPWREVPAFYASLGDSSGHAALKMLILTASRSRPIRYAHRDQIDGDVWTVPSDLMKGRKGKATEFRVPLTSSMLDVIGTRDGLLFPGRRGTVMSDMTLTAILRRRGLQCVPHGFRSSFRDWAAEHGVDYEVAETCLAHTVGSQASRAYARSDLLERRRAVMQHWSAFVTGQTSADVVSFRA